MAKDLRIAAEDLSPVATQQQTYVMPERRGNQDIQFKADTLQRVFAKGQQIASQYKADLFKEEYRRNAELAQFKADTEFTKMTGEIEPLLETTDPNDVEALVAEKYNKYFQGVHEEGQDPFLQAALSKSYYAYVPDALKKSYGYKQERDKQNFLDTFSENTAVWLDQAMNNNMSMDQLSEGLNQRFLLAKGNQFGATPQELNVQILMHGHDQKYRQFISEYAKRQKLDKVNNSDYETELNKINSAMLKDEWQTGVHEELLTTLNTLAMNGDVQTITDITPAFLEHGNSYGKDMSEEIASAKKRALKAKADLNDKVYDKGQFSASVDATMSTGEIQLFDKKDGNPVSQSAVTREVDKRYMANPMAYPAQLARWQVKAWKTKADSFVNDLKDLDNPNNWHTHKDGKAVTMMRDGQEISVGDYKKAIVSDFLELGDGFEKMGVGVAETQMGKENFFTYELVKEALANGQSIDQIALVMRSDPLEEKVTNKQADTVLTNLNTGDEFFDIGWLDDESKSTGGARGVIKRMLTYAARLNGGNMAAAQASVTNMLKGRYYTVEMYDGVGGGISFIDFGDKELIKAFSNKDADGNLFKDKDGDIIVAPINEVKDAFEEVMKLRYQYRYKPMYDNGDLIDDPADFYLLEYPQKEGTYLVMTESGGIVETVSAKQLGDFWHERKLGIANSKRHQQARDANQEYIDGLVADAYMDDFDNPSTPNDTYVNPEDKVYEDLKKQDLKNAKDFLRSEREKTEMAKPRAHYTEQQLRDYRRDNGITKDALTFPTEEAYQKQLKETYNFILDNDYLKYIEGGIDNASNAEEMESTVKKFISWFTAGNVKAPKDVKRPESWLNKMFPEFTDTDKKFGKRSKKED